MELAVHTIVSKVQLTLQHQHINFIHYAGCCFVKYATSEEADRAIRALHNQHTLPGVSSLRALVLQLLILCSFFPCLNMFLFSRELVLFKLDMLMENENDWVVTSNLSGFLELSLCCLSKYVFDETLFLLLTLGAV